MNIELFNFLLVNSFIESSNECHCNSLTTKLSQEDAVDGGHVARGDYTITVLVSIDD